MDEKQQNFADLNLAKSHRTSPIMEKKARDMAMMIYKI